LNFTAAVELSSGNERTGMADTYLSVVDGDDFVIARQLRSVIHAQGLRHREVHVWFLTKNRELVVQRRAATKDTYPNMLDATASGHVEEGQDYMSAALAEAREETGLDLNRHLLTPLAKVDVTQVDATRGVTNTVFRMVYLFRFNGELTDLTVEEQDGAGFLTIPLADVLAKRGPLVNEMVPGFFEAGYAPAWQAMRDVLKV